MFSQFTFLGSQLSHKIFPCLLRKGFWRGALLSGVKTCSYPFQKLMSKCSNSLHEVAKVLEFQPNAGRDWGQEEKETAEAEMAGWHHRLDATRVWVNSRTW